MRHPTPAELHRLFQAHMWREYAMAWDGRKTATGVGRTGVIRARSTVPGMDWSVEMDEGCYDLDAAANALEPIDDDQADNWTAEEREHEAV